MSSVFAPPAYGGGIGNLLCAKREAIIHLRRFMEGSTAADTTQLLRAWADGDSGDLEQLTPRVYRELRDMAHGCWGTNVLDTAFRARIWCMKSIFVW